MFQIKAALFCALMAAFAVFAQEPPARSLGQFLYLPVYSHIWHGDVDRSGLPVKALVSVLVSVRNTDPVRPMRLVSAQYYDTDGKRIKEYISAPRIIGPMGTYELFIPRSDDTGGSGANFVIAWRSDAPINPPIVEGVHANLPTGRSIAFITSAQPIHRD
mgnify:CR=1 FL=1